MSETPYTCHKHKFQSWTRPCPTCERESKDAEIERLYSWAGLVSIVDELYPADIAVLNEGDDPGPRMLRLIREIDRLQARVQTLEGHLDWLGWSSDGVEKAKSEIERLRAELRWYGHEIAGGGPIRGYKRAAQIAEARWYSTTKMMLTENSCNDPSGAGGGD